MSNIKKSSKSIQGKKSKVSKKFAFKAKKSSLKDENKLPTVNFPPPPKSKSK